MCDDVREQVGLCQPNYVVATGVRFDDLDLVQALFEGPGKKVLSPSYELMKNYYSVVQAMSHDLDLLVMNHEEVCAGLDKPVGDFEPDADIVKLFKLLYAQALLVTYNSNGAFYCTKIMVIHQPSLSVDVIDPTGAGDSFLGGFLHRQLEGFSIEDSMKFAAACAAAKIRKVGGSNVPTMEEVKEFLK